MLCASLWRATTWCGTAALSAAVGVSLEKDPPDPVLGAGCGEALRGPDPQPPSGASLGFRTHRNCEIQLTYNIILVSSVQQKDSVFVNIAK